MSFFKDIALFNELRLETGRLIKEANWLRTLEMPPEWKVIFFRMGVSRGFRDIRKYKTELLEISDSSTDILLLFIEEKLIGIDTLYVVATKMDDKCKMEYFMAVKKYGVKSNEAILIYDKCVSGLDLPLNLLDFMRDED